MTAVMYVDIRSVGGNSQTALPSPSGRGLGGGRVGDDGPVLGRGHVEGEDALEVGLLEGRVDAAGVGHLELRVGVDPVVDGVDEAVQALAGAGVGAVGAYDELVGRPGGRSSRIRWSAYTSAGSSAVPLRVTSWIGGADQVGERLGAGLGARERDRRGGGEGRLAGRQVELHGVGVDAEQPGAGLRLVAGQVGSRHARHHCTEAGQRPNRVRAGAGLLIRQRE